MGCLIHRHSVGTLRHRKGKGGFLPSGRHFQTKGVAAQSEMAYKVTSGKSRVRFHAIACNLCASVALQSTPCASTRFQAIWNDSTGASLYGTAPMPSPNVLQSEPLNEIMLILSTTVIHSF